MNNELLKRDYKRGKRVVRVRKHLRGDAAKLRMSVCKTNQHLSVQLIDDENSKTVLSLGTVMKEFRTKNMKKSKDAAKAIGTKIAEMAREKQISRVVFDRGRHRYHGVIAELANAARAGGLQF